MVSEGENVAGAPPRAGAILLVALGLLAIGLVMVASATASLDRPLLVWPMWTTTFGRQVVFALAGLVVMLLTAWLGKGVLSGEKAPRIFAITLFVLVFLALVAALVPGLMDPRRGSQRWVGLGDLGGGLSFQPSELAKVAMVIMLAAVLTWPGVSPRSFFRAFVPASCVIGLCVALVGTADFGTAALLAVTGGAILFVSGCRWRHLLAVGLAGLGGLVALLYAAPYRLERLRGFGQLWEDPQGVGYQPLQSLTAIASGAWYGVGLGAGVGKYSYLPESHTDFIFSVICEEAGVVGAGVVIALFATLTVLGWRVMRWAPTPFVRIAAFGLTVVVAVQAMMNVAVATAVAPTTGISLPLVSAGGSGMLSLSFAVGLLAAAARCGGTRASQDELSLPVGAAEVVS